MAKKWVDDKYGMALNKKGLQFFGPPTTKGWRPLLYSTQSLYTIIYTVYTIHYTVYTV